MLNKIVVLILLCMNFSFAQEQFIPKSSPGDKGKYYLISVESVPNGNLITLHKRVGVYDINYTKTEINCSNKTYRVIAESDASLDEVKNIMVKDAHPALTKWTELVVNSSKYDLVTFVCKQ